ncbi:MAG: hypothetical protein KDB53_10265 [Planctomycetes bacterium]|nr:hypothetical protein [Planctomycetota bacterium]
MSENEQSPAPAPKQVPDVRDIAVKPDSRKPPTVSDREWRKARIDAGHMVVIRSHFKSIFLIPMAMISLIAGVSVNLSDTWESTWGLIWTIFFALYMNIFIFEWNRAWTVVLMASTAMFVAIGFAVESETFPIWTKLYDFFKALDLKYSAQAYFFYAIFFAFCAGISYVKTRLNYVVIEHNEMQIYRNAFFGDRERLSMLNPRIEVLVSDMVEYFHPFYRAGTVVIHAPTKTIVLENVLHIRKIERVTDRLGSTLSVRVEHESRG